MPQPSPETIQEAYQTILSSSWFAPETLKKYLAALRIWQKDQVAANIDGQIIERQQMIQDLQHFLRSLPDDQKQTLADQGVTPASLEAADPDSLSLLETIINEVAGLAPEIPPANIPINLEELKAEAAKRIAEQEALSLNLQELQDFPNIGQMILLAQQNAQKIRDLQAQVEQHLQKLNLEHEKLAANIADSFNEKLEKAKIEFKDTSHIKDLIAINHAAASIPLKEEDRTSIEKNKATEITAKIEKETINQLRQLTINIAKETEKKVIDTTKTPTQEQIKTTVELQLKAQLGEHHPLYAVFKDLPKIAKDIKTDIIDQVVNTITQTTVVAALNTIKETKDIIIPSAEKQLTQAEKQFASLLKILEAHPNLPEFLKGPRAAKTIARLLSSIPPSVRIGIISRLKLPAGMTEPLITIIQQLPAAPRPRFQPLLSLFQRPPKALTTAATKEIARVIAAYPDAPEWLKDKSQVKKLAQQLVSGPVEEKLIVSQLLGPLPAPLYEALWAINQQRLPPEIAAERIARVIAAYPDTPEWLKDKSQVRKLTRQLLSGPIEKETIVSQLLGSVPGQLYLNIIAAARGLPALTPSLAARKIIQAITDYPGAPKWLNRNAISNLIKQLIKTDPSQREQLITALLGRRLPKNLLQAILTPVQQLPGPSRLSRPWRETQASWRAAQIRYPPAAAFARTYGAARQKLGYLPRGLSYSFRTGGSLTKHRLISPFKSWAYRGLYRGGIKLASWGARQTGKGLIKRGLGKIALKLGTKLAGTAAAGLAAQAVPVAGQIAGALMLASTANEIWQKNKKKILTAISSTIGVGVFLVSKLISAAITAIITTGATVGLGLLGGIVGFALGGPVGAAVGATIGGVAGYKLGTAITAGGVAHAATQAVTSAATATSTSIATVTSPTIGSSIASTLTNISVLGGLITVGTTVTVTMLIIAAAMFVPPGQLTDLETQYQIVEGGPFPIGIAHKCEEGGEEITPSLASRITNGGVRLLPNTITARSEEGRYCITPTTIVMHWSAGSNDNPNGNEATYNTLVGRNRACQLGVDTNDVEFWQPFYETEVEMAWCANSFNAFSISNEMAGTFFTGNPPPPNLDELELSYQATCAIMEQYQIPWCQIYGHFEVPDSGGKIDPGEDFLYDVFIPAIQSRCPNDPENICS